MRRTAELHASQTFDFGPLFGGQTDEERRQSYAVDPEQRLNWVRRTLLLSGMDTFTAEDVRSLVVKLRPHLLESGRWIGFVFRSPLFRPVNPEHAKRDEAKARWLWRYALTDDGQVARNKLSREGRSPAGFHTPGAGGSTPPPATNTVQSEAGMPPGAGSPGSVGSTPATEDGMSMEKAGDGGEAKSGAAEFNGSVPSGSASTDEEADPPTRILDTDPCDRTRRALLIDDIRSCRLEDDAAYKRVWDQAQESFGPFDLINARIDVVRRFHVMCYAAITKPAQRRRAL